MDSVINLLKECIIECAEHADKKFKLLYDFIIIRFDKQQVENEKINLKFLSLEYEIKLLKLENENLKTIKKI